MEMSVKVFILALGVLVFSLRLCHAHEAESGSCPFSSHASHDHHHHDHNHHHSHRREVERSTRSKLPEEMAEEEDLELYGFSHEPVGDSGVQGLSKISLWGSAMGCSLLVSMASLVCIIILPVLFSQGKPSKVVVDSLAAFGAGAMLGDAFLHQLPHAFGGGHSHSHEHHVHDSPDYHTLGHESSHAHSLEDLSVGLSVLSGIVLFLLVEKIVRYVEDHSTGGHELGHGHHHHHHKSNNKLKKGATDKSDSKSHVDGKKPDPQNNDLRKRSASEVTDADKSDPDALNSSTTEETVLASNGPAQSQSNLVFGYLNLFSDGVHNFTDGMALGSAFLLHGSVGGWSRTLFLLAHELPQEVGDFGILVRSGFSVPKALFFNFLSALVALVGTALALLLGKNPGQSSLIEGFTAGGFIYIAAAGVLPEMNNGNTSFKSTVIQLTALLMGMGVALCISLVE